MGSSKSSRKKKSLLRRFLFRKRSSSKRRSWTEFLAAIFQPQWLTKLGSRASKAFFSFHTPKWMGSLTDYVKPLSKRPKWSDYFNPIYWVIWSAKFLLSWILSRPYTSLGPALPALMVAIALGVLVYRQRVQGTLWRSNIYRTELAQSFNNQDFDTAAVCVNTLIDLFPDDLEYRYQRAVIEEKRDNLAMAMDMMGRLAVNKQYGPAAMWMVAKKFDLQKLASWERADHVQFRGFMEIAMKDLKGMNLVNAKTMMASYLAGIGAKNEAVKYLVEASSLNRELSLTTAALCRELGDLEQAKRLAEDARKLYLQRLTNAPNSIDDRLNMVRAMMILDNEAQAEQVLLDGLRITEEPKLREALGELLVSWSNRIGKNDKSPTALLQRMQLIQRGLSYSPNNEMVVDSVIQLLFECKDDKNQEVLIIRKAIVQGINPESTHFIRGTLALMRNDYEKAKVDLELAAKYGANLPGILNNLAVAISGKNDGDLEQALTFANAAIERLPNHPYLMETRGQILFKLKRYKESISDLEQGLKAPELAPQIHASLAVAYRELGETELADEYDALVKRHSASTNKQ